MVSNDAIMTLDEYVILPITIELLKTVIKEWLIDVEVYNIFLDITLMKQVNSMQKFGKKKMIIKSNDQKI